MLYQTPEVIEIGNAQKLIRGSFKDGPVTDMIDGEALMIDYAEESNHPD